MGVEVSSPSAATQLTEFVGVCEAATGLSFADHAAFDAFAVGDHRRFWAEFLRWSDLLHEGELEPVCTDDAIERATFFPRVRLNYAENLLRCDAPQDAARVAVVAHRASGTREVLSRGELRDRVRAVAAQLRALGVGPGDVVAAVAGNNANAVVGALAAASIGAPFASAAPEMGAAAIVGRFEQVRPKVLLANLAAGGEAAPTALADRVAEVARALPSLVAVVALDDGPAPGGVHVRCVPLDDAPSPAGDDGAWDRFPFNHPLFVMFSSGTTGRPKCIVHGAGGTLLEHVKEHRLHVDMRPSDRMLFHTSAAWMMWNWQLSALASGAEVVLYDGPLPAPDSLWRLVSAEEVSVFGTSPPYLQLCAESGVWPRELPLERLRVLLSTGSILHDEQYDWVRDHVADIPVQSISGGTDIIGCFVLGNPNRPVRRGWVQCRSLGLDVRALGGASVGELVCANPFPSRPLGFLNDDDGSAFHAAYFAANDGMWTHGDLIEFDGEGNARLHGRSDGVLNVGGVRIGPAEIYRALQGVPEVREGLAVEQAIAGGSRIVLAVVLREDAQLDARLDVRIRREIARNASPVHVPGLIVAVDELPVTHSAKRSERAARDVLNDEPVGNIDALANPASLAALREAVSRADEQLRIDVDVDAAATVEERVLAIWESVLGVAPLSRHDAFFDVGGTSLAAVRVFQAIHDELGIDLPLSTLLHAHTSAALAAVIEAPAALRVPPLVLLRPGPAERPVFMVHGVAGDVMHLRPLALRIGTERPVYGLQARGLDPLVAPQECVEEMAEAYIATIRTVHPHGPYSLVGHSFGALVAYEMACRLRASGLEVDALGLVEPVVHHRCLSAPRRALFVAGRARRHRDLGLTPPRNRLARAVGGAVRRPAPEVPSGLPPLQGRVERVNRDAFRAYRPPVYDGDVTIFLAENDEPGFCDPLPIWRRAVRGRLDVERVSGGHDSVVREPYAPDTGERLSALLAPS